MDLTPNKRANKYDRVMSRVQNISRSTLKSPSLVTRHEIPSSVSVGAKPSGSNVSSSLFSELPVVLNDYSPEVPPQRKFVVKPRKTIRSLNPATSPHRPLPVPRTIGQPVPKIRTRGSAPVVTNRHSENWSDSHLRQCYSSRSHCKLKELKDEIKAYRETDRQMKLRSKLYKSCGVILDDVGQVAADKAVQVQVPEVAEADKEQYSARSQSQHVGEDARAPVFDQQMRPGRTKYPVDRYLVESNKKVEMVNIIDDEIWNSEPALRPEDEIILKKLHDMLQSTADDLKLLSGELSKINQPGVQVTKSQPAPLDEEFNEKVHIEEIVNAKFHGHKIVEKTLPFSPEFKPNKNLVNELLASKVQKPKSVNTSVQVNSSLLKKEDKTKHLKTTRLQTVHINENNVVGSKSNLLNNEKPSKSFPTVSYNEIVHEYVKPRQKNIKQQFSIQNMPSINIRSELMEQKVFQLDILPELKDNPNANTINKNIGVVELLFESPIPRPPSKASKSTNQTAKKSQHQIQDKNSFKIPVRKISKMSTYESSESTNNLSSDAQHKLNIRKLHKLATKISPKRSARTDVKNKKNLVSKKPEKRSHSNLDEWNHKLNSIYGQPSSSRKGMPSMSKKVSPKRSNLSSKINTHSKTLNNGEYVPYSKLTLGGVRVSDIEREINDIPNKNDLELSPILDKILSSRENSFHNDSPRKKQHTHSPKILTTSDENLLQEVIDIEKTVSETLSKEFKTISKDIQLNSQNENLLSDGSVESYADDFEDEKSQQSNSSKDRQLTENIIDSGKSGDLNESHHSQNGDEGNHEGLSNGNQNENLQNVTYTKALNLSFKDTVDIFEFVHSVDTQETGTQSNSASKISLKETQTSPRTDRSVIQPIRNDLWPSIDPKGEIESLFQIEKEFIKKLIIDEYGEIIEHNIMKPSSSKEKDDEDRKNNVAAFQKNTQTSPARVKCAMTSPTKTKTRTTSPFTLSLKVDRQTSPMMAINNEELKIVIDNEPDDLGISINLSSPRFSLRLPQNSREVLSNLDNISATSSKTDLGNTKRKNQLRSLKSHPISSSSSVDADNSSSEISSLGEVKFKLKKKNKKTTRVQSISLSSSSSVVSQRSSEIPSGDILPLKSEGEVSLGQAIRRPRTQKESEGEMNFRPL